MGIFDQQQNPFVQSASSLAPVHTGTIFDPLGALGAQLQSRNNDRVKAQLETQAKSDAITRADSLAAQSLQNKQDAAVLANTNKVTAAKVASDSAIRVQAAKDAKALEKSTKRSDILFNSLQSQNSKSLYTGKQLRDFANAGRTSLPSDPNALSQFDKLQFMAQERELIRRLPTTKQLTDARGAASGHAKATSIISDITSKIINDPSISGLTGFVRGLAEPVAAFAGQGDLLPPKVTRIKDQSAILQTLSRKALSGGGTQSDRDKKSADEIISSINWTGQQETIVAKLKDLQDLLDGRNLSNLELIRISEDTQAELKDLSTLRVGNTPPIKGANKAPDGNWYIERPKGSGRFFRVEAK